MPFDLADTLLSPEQHAGYAARGWTAAPGFFSAQEAAEMGRWTDELAARREAAGAHMVYWEPSVLDPAVQVRQRIEDFCPVHPGFDSLVHGRLKAACAELLGDEAVLFKDKINFKEPGGAGFKLHQDQQAGWSAYAPLFLTALVTLDRSTPENGCLEMAQGPRLSSLIGPEWVPLSPEGLDGRALTSVPVRTGRRAVLRQLCPPRLGAEPDRPGPAHPVSHLQRRQSRRPQAALLRREARQLPPRRRARLAGVEYRFRV